jgi:hypothetical protein
MDSIIEAACEHRRAHEHGANRPLSSYEVFPGRLRPDCRRGRDDHPAHRAPDGHIQAVGTDDAGRRQYLYHSDWRERQDQEKHERMLAFGTALPGIRAAVDKHLAGEDLSRERVLAAAIRLIDLGFFRPGGREYATHNGSFGLATIRREHVRLTRGQVLFEYTAKSGRHREQAVADSDVLSVIRRVNRSRPSDRGRRLGPLEPGRAVLWAGSLRSSALRAVRVREMSRETCICDRFISSAISVWVLLP